MAQQFDVVIVGGAMTGSILALALSSFTDHKMQIAIVEKIKPDFKSQGGFDARSIALAQGSLQKLQKIQPLGTTNLSDVVRRISTSIQKIQVSDQHHFGKTTLKATEMHLPQLGVVVELAKLGFELSQLIQKHSNIQLFCPDTVANIERNQTACEITLSSGTQLKSALIVAADGIQSQIAKQCGVETVQLRDYNQSAIIANVEISQPHQQQAFERFTLQGPLALLPLCETAEIKNQMSLVWCVNDPSGLLSLSDEEFLAKLQQNFGWKLGKFLRTSRRFSYPLQSQKATSHIHHRLAIVGNASQLLHPVAGQGFNLGMRDLFELAKLLSGAFEQGNDLGDYALLSQFEKNRLADQNKIIRSTSGLISIFCCEFLPVQLARTLGLIGLDHFKIGREWVANRALGW
ncbi:2-octaprenyl-6-methoxyphenyl hydroxylase [Pasteurella atlantica]|uniref:2-octaprenyl-6-methoxyphenyl hydroxylase n=1 Tax=Pasteurellaceae TaxID=712 RepID=UPI00275B0101|nr:2-octaprenyl-6-methoxyphenyl hydroxylase [Pasteurella atlantica]MDP8033174.1 2-octaprenyl-6-methoxyphenyl hydroxylase [Pasteurella atlantica]MDP8035111.1 2-octaprenyl-6-methoxyphenyl hydroxylase [Pasteurella atlantica]MDP8036929.1 2-octaprenyl-6-methoxyphenyl hydroxylase [Pasteurella atlantica]MDP8047545.1 2-octaprenyl-6-methoxyphenyl hydroxylase [Pasteurella atlantica]MDP8049214.1 2-octaprenyl-6-methoxyphenyl hydroxylase [Pasteurella atlantica]